MTDEDVWSQDCYDRLMAHRPSQLAIDSETTGLAWTDTAFGVSFAWYENKRGGEGIIPVLCSGYIDIRYASELWNNVKAWIKEAQPELVGWNIKFDAHKLGIYPQPDKMQDGCLMTYILNENFPKKLKIVAQKVLKVETDEDTVLKQTRKELGLTAADGYDKIPLSVLVPYARVDAELTLRLYHRLQTALEKEPDLVAVYEVEKQLLLAVAGTERRGIGVDTDYLRFKIVELGDEIIQLEREIADIVGKPIGDGKKKIRIPDGKYKNGNPKFRIEVPNEFNPNSPQQVSEYFESVGVIVSSTAEDALKAVTHPLATALVKLRGCCKDRNTFLGPMLEEAIHDPTYDMMVCHPNLNLTSTRTKRMSSSGASDG